MNQFSNIKTRSRSKQQKVKNSPKLSLDIRNDIIFEEQQQDELESCMSKCKKFEASQKESKIKNDNEQRTMILPSNSQDDSLQIVEASDDLDLNASNTKFETSSVKSEASTIKKQPIYDQFASEFSDFSYDEEFKALEEDEEFGDVGSVIAQDQIKQESKERATKRKRTSKSGPDRKVRTTITKQKLEELNVHLKEFFDLKFRHVKPEMTLREISTKINLSYSTTLHKAALFRKNKEVKPGKFLSSLTKKRKYKKSYECEEYIEKALKVRPFYTAEAIAKYILRQFRVSYPRAIIGRHLKDMGYSSNNIKPHLLEKNGAKCINLRKLYANILQPLLVNPTLLVYVDEAAFSKNIFRVKTTYSSYEYEKQKKQTQDDYISVMIAMTSQRIVYYHIREGFYQRLDFIDAISEIYYSTYLHTYNSTSLYLINDMHKIHFDEDLAGASQNQEHPKQSVQAALFRYGIKRIFLPPGSPQLNPIEILISYLKNLLFTERGEITDTTSLKTKIDKFMRLIANESTKRFFYDFDKWFAKAKAGQSF